MLITVVRVDTSVLPMDKFAPALPANVHLVYLSVCLILEVAWLAHRKDKTLLIAVHPDVWNLEPHAIVPEGDTAKP